MIAQDPPLTPGSISWGKKQFKVFPLNIIRVSEINSWIRQQVMNPAIAAIALLEDSEQQQRMIGAAAVEASRFTFHSTDGRQFLKSKDGMAKWVSVCTDMTDSQAYDYVEEGGHEAAIQFMDQFTYVNGEAMSQPVQQEENDTVKNSH
jgi:hypothetical protein